MWWVLALGLAAGDEIEILLPSPLEELVSQLNHMQMMPWRTPLANPCAEDQRRLSCSDSACLRRSAETLAPACAALLLGSPEPSAFPERRPPTGFFTMLSSADGEVRRVSGPIAGRLDGPDEMRMPALASIIPPDFLGLLGLRQSLLEEEEEDEVEEGPAQHPCAREVSACIRETGNTRRDTIEACLVKHLAQLSSECKCFVHHVAEHKLPPAAAQPRVPARAPTAVPTAVLD